MPTASRWRTTRPSGKLVDALTAPLQPSLSGTFTLADGRKAVPVFQLLAERFLSAEYAPEKVEKETGVAADSIRRIAAELAHAAFKEEIALDIPWTDWTGRRHDKMIGRPVGMHAMRGISAHSNGFHTCRILHLLQILLGSIDCPAAFATRRPSRSRRRPFLKPRGKPGDVKPMQPLPGPPLGFPTGPEDLLVDAAGTPQRIDKAFSWDAPFSAHGLMHMVIANAAQAAIPIPIDVLFMYMANMSWNSSMNMGATLEHLTDKDPATGEYKIPKIIYSDAYFSEMVPYADLILPDTTYLERWDCISLLDRPISEPDGPADAIRQPVVEPDRDVRPFQDVLIDLGARLKLPGIDEGRRLAASFRAAIPTTSSITSASPASARWPASAARPAARSARASPTRTSSSATSPTAASTCTTCRPICATSSMPTATTSTGRSISACA